MNIKHLVTVAVFVFSVAIIASPVLSQSNPGTIFIPSVESGPIDRLPDAEDPASSTPPVTTPIVVPATATIMPTSVVSSTPVPSNTPADPHTSTPPPTATPTVTPTNTAMPTSTSTATWIPTNTPTDIPTNTPTNTPTPTFIPTQTPVPAQTPTATPRPENEPNPAIRVLPQTSIQTSSIVNHLIGQVEETAGGRANLVRVTANFYNGAQLTGTEFTYTPLDIVMPGTQTCFRISMLNEVPQHTHIEYELTHSSGREISSGLITENVSLNVNDDDLEVIGLVRNTGQQKSTFVKVVVTLFDQASTPIGCNYAYVNSTDLNPGQSSSFRVDFRNMDSSVHSYRVQVQGRPSNEPPFVPRVQVLPNTYTYSGLVSDYLVGEIEALGGESASQIKVTVNFYENGTLTGTDWTYPPMDRLAAGERTCFQILQLGRHPRHTHYEFEISHAGPRPVSPALTILNDSASVNGSWARIIGSVRNDGHAEAKFVQVIATLFDSSGTPIECDYGYVNSTNLIPGQSSTFDINYIRNGPQMHSYRLQAQGRP